MAQPLYDLLLKGKQFGWGEKQQTAFEEMKGMSVLAPVLRQPKLDKPFIVECDSSDKATGAVLSQIYEDGKVHPVAFMSKTLAPAERNYDIYDKELLAVIRAFKEWRHWLEGTLKPVLLVTDHKNLEYFMTTKTLTKRQSRWAVFLSEFHFVIRYRPGGLNGKADILSRRDSGLEGGVVPQQPLIDPSKFELAEVGDMDEEDNERLQVQLLGPNGKMPVRSSKEAAGYDLHSSEETWVPGMGLKVVGKEIALKIPKGVYGRVAPRSGLAVKS